MFLFRLPSLPFTCVIPWLLLAVPLRAAPPDLRTQTSLDGTWTRNGEEVTIPELKGADTLKTGETLVYEREVRVPADWSLDNGERLRIEFLAVNFIAEVLVNGESLGTHLGAWLPFGFDLPAGLAPGDTFTLTVNVQGSSTPPYSTNGLANFPIGNQNLGERGNHGRFSGITDRVWLRKYGRVAIRDAFIQTSTREQKLTVTYTVENSGSRDEEIQIQGVIAREGMTQQTKVITSTSVHLPAGDRREIKVEETWTDPLLWTPDTPRLYVLSSRVLSGNRTLDREQRRFGFREVWIEDGKYMLNGNRINLIGGSTHPPIPPEEWEKEIAAGKKLHFNVFRIHPRPGPQWMLEAADQQGMFIISESAFYGPARQYNHKDPGFVDNVIHWSERWVRSQRNHPCIFKWSASNETSRGGTGTGWTAKLLPPEALRTIGQAVKAVDPGRPVIFDGDGDIGWNTINIHYPEGMNRTYSGSIYKWADRVDPDRPTGIGEFLTHGWPGASKEPDVFWWQGTLIRGLRFLGFADLRPYTNHYWAMQGKGSPEAVASLANSYAPVALFDKAYDDLGIAHLISRNWPELEAGSTTNRTLLLHNNDYQGTYVTVEAALALDGTVLARAEKKVNLSLGHHLEIPCSFTIPAQPGKTLELILRTRKEGTLRFEEARHFRITGTGTSPAAEVALKLGGAE